MHRQWVEHAFACLVAVVSAAVIHVAAGWMYPLLSSPWAAAAAACCCSSVLLTLCSAAKLRQLPAERPLLLSWVPGRLLCC